MALTEAKVRNAKTAEKSVKLTDANDMHLLVQSNGSKYRRLQYRFEGKQKMLALGVYPAISLTEARCRRDKVRQQIANNIDSGGKQKRLKRKVYSPLKPLPEAGMPAIKSGLRGIGH